MVQINSLVLASGGGVTIIPVIHTGGPRYQVAGFGSPTVEHLPDIMSGLPLSCGRETRGYGTLPLTPSRDDLPDCPTGFRVNDRSAARWLLVLVTQKVNAQYGG
jgi:hypothetical protein